MRLHPIFSVVALMTSAMWAHPVMGEPLLGFGSPDTDLSRPFATRSVWHLKAAQGAPVDFAGEKAPGEIDLCLTKAGSNTCDPQLRSVILPDAPSNPYARPHFLVSVDTVYPQGDANEPLLMIRSASLAGMNGDQLVLTQLLAYRPEMDEFFSVYEHVTGKNNDQEVRYVQEGPLRGSVISAEPTQDAPFGFWISVSGYVPGRSYQQIVKYRSATKYGDNNSLPVIDSEEIEIRKRLGLWRAGMALPLPTRQCLKPRLVRMELWCD